VELCTITYSQAREPEALSNFKTIFLAAITKQPCSGSQRH
jgi:hypothetical protein